MGEECVGEHELRIPRPRLGYRYLRAKMRGTSAHDIYPVRDQHSLVRVVGDVDIIEHRLIAERFFYALCFKYSFHILFRQVLVCEARVFGDLAVQTVFIQPFEERVPAGGIDVAPAVCICLVLGTDPFLAAFTISGSSSGTAPQRISAALSGLSIAYS